MTGSPITGVAESALQVATGLAASGARAVVLTGSHARGEAHPESDLDLFAFGEGPRYFLQRHGAFLVSISWRTVEEERRVFTDPALAGGAVPAWRRVVILHDPDGIAAALRREAEEWDWGAIAAARCDDTVAEWLTGFAEEVHKLVTSLARGQRWTAAVQRSVLALRLAQILALHLRLLYETENCLWERVGAGMDDRWRRAQAGALGTGGESLKESCDAALELYALAARAVLPLLGERQRAVVAHACMLAQYPLNGQGAGE